MLRQLLPWQNARVQRYYEAWADKRHSDGLSTTLEHRNVYILPTQAGFVYAGLSGQDVDIAMLKRGGQAVGVAFVCPRLVVTLHTRVLRGQELTQRCTHPRHHAHTAVVSSRRATSSGVLALALLFASRRCVTVCANTA